MGWVTRTIERRYLFNFSNLCRRPQQEKGPSRKRPLRQERCPRWRPRKEEIQPHQDLLQAARCPHPTKTQGSWSLNVLCCCVGTTLIKLKSLKQKKKLTQK